MKDTRRLWSIKELYRRLVLALLGKKKVTPTELGLLIANDVFSHIGHSPTPFGPFDPFFRRLPPEDRKLVVVESTIAHVMFFTHFFMESCGNAEFATKTCQCFAGLIALRMSENDDFQLILGLGERPLSARQSYEELAEAFYERGNFYLGILGTCPDGDYTAFHRACGESVGRRRQDVVDGYARSNADTLDTLAAAFQRVIGRIWENMTPA